MNAEDDFCKAVQPAAGCVRLQVKVVPGASRSAVVGMLGDRLKLTVTAPAEGGRANKAVCELIATRLGVSRSAVTVISGASRPEKVIEVAAVAAKAVCKALAG